MLEGEASHQTARKTDELEKLECGLLFRSIGYHGVAIPGVPFDERRGVFPNREGRIIDGETPVPGLYATGWIKRGPTGIIGTNRADSVETVKSLLDDFPNFGAAEKPGADGLADLFKSRRVRVVSFEEWRKIDSAEIQRGEAIGKPREKFTRIEDMLSVLDRPGKDRVSP